MLAALLPASIFARFVILGRPPSALLRGGLGLNE
jgi:hypothetical protein